MLKHRLTQAVELPALVFHRLVVLKDGLAHLEVAFFHLALCLLHGARQHGGFDGIAFLHAEFGKQSEGCFTCEHLHQFVIKCKEESAGALVALAAGATAQLVVDATTFVAFSANDVQSTHVFHRCKEAQAVQHEVAEGVKVVLQILGVGGGYLVLGDAWHGFKHPVPQQCEANVFVRHAFQFGGGNRTTLAAQHALGHVTMHGSQDAFFAPFGSDFLGAEIAALPVFNQEGGLALAKFDVSTATGHIGGDHHCAEFASACHDFCFALMLLRVEHFVVNAVLLLEFAAEELALLNAGGANQHRATSVMEALDLINDRAPLVLLTQEHQVIAIAADHGLVGGDTDHAKLVNLIELSGFSVGSTSHAREALVKLEEVLDGDGGHRLRLFLNRDAFLRFNGLMQSVGPLPTHHLATGVLVNNDDGLLSLIIRSHHVIAVALIDGVSAHGLFKKVGHVHVLAHVETTDLGFALCFGDAFVGQRGAFLIKFHFVVLHALVADLLKFAEFGLCSLEAVAQYGLCGTVARVANFAFNVRSLGLCNFHLLISGFPRGLLAHKVLGKAVRHFVAGLDGVGHTADDERCARFVNQDGIDFIDDRKLTASLHLVFRARLHVVAQVIEAELGGGSVHHVAGVCLALPFVTLHVHGMDGANRKPKRAEERERPVAVALH